MYVFEVNSNESAQFLYIVGIDLAPKYVLEKIGKNEPKNTIKYEDISPNPNMIIAMGIHAIGGIGLSSSI